MMDPSRSVVLNQGWLHLPGDIWQCLDKSWLSQLWGCTNSSVAVKEAAKCPTTHQRARTTIRWVQHGMCGLCGGWYPVLGRGGWHVQVAEMVTIYLSFWLPSCRELKILGRQGSPFPAPLAPRWAVG